jgi:transposase
MTRDEKIAKARELRDQGLTHRAIGDRLGVTHSCVTKWLNPNLAREWARRQEAKPSTAARKRAWDRAHRATCPRCGGLRGQATAIPSRADGLCVNCDNAARAAEADVTARKVVALWADGKKFSEICAAMGWSKGTLSAMMDRYRKAGYDLPYRRQGEALENVRRGQAGRRDRVAA